MPARLGLSTGHWPAFLLVGAIASTGVVAMPVQEDEAPPSGEETAPEGSPGAREQDREAIRSVMRSFEEAFEARDAEALAAHWTEEGELRTDSGELVRGRSAIRQAFSAFFAQAPEVSADVRPEALRFLSSGSAVEEGTVAVRRGPTRSETRASYRALLVREEGAWLLAQLIESAADAPSIEDLAWLIGDWASEVGEGTEIRTSYAWVPNKKFIQSRFSIKDQGLELSGMQVIGVDPAFGTIHTWTFGVDGGVGEADWYEDGGHWVLDAAGTLPDGRTLFETNILRRIDDDMFTWQSVDRLLDDVELPDLPPVKVTRVSTEE
ncbi:YybH family protein [Tautonia sociabilis]|uniref:SgcJ/EcaC family oxidoreductase n=1 Tax=Tautonia sociabilis TaxID=2080755 RepID=A0A432MDZ9_9BACT|nr:SgcJ/EcaC family oxidoreductase [Tautonia sociabilis]RUL83314.1 SgcJ/EcaC family oxidoreductase [Tautonia sociabilis]